MSRATLDLDHTGKSVELARKCHRSGWRDRSGCPLIHSLAMASSPLSLRAFGNNEVM
jgi:hypothetical protein